jgi:hypothetical protein
LISQSRGLGDVYKRQVRKSSIKIYRPELQSEKLQPTPIAPKQFENWKGVANPKKLDKIEDHPPLKQFPEQEIRQPDKPVPEKISPSQDQQHPIKQEPVILQPEKEIHQPNIPVPERITPRQELQVPEKEKPVLQPRQQEMPHQDIEQPIPRKENRPILESPSQPKPIQQRPPRQRINEVPRNDYQPPIRKSVPEDKPTFKQTLPPKRKP